MGHLYFLFLLISCLPALGFSDKVGATHLSVRAQGLHRVYF